MKKMLCRKCKKAISDFASRRKMFIWAITLILFILTKPSKFSARASSSIASIDTIQIKKEIERREEDIKKITYQIAEVVSEIEREQSRLQKATILVGNSKKNLRKMIIVIDRFLKRTSIEATLFQQNFSELSTIIKALKNEIVKEYLKYIKEENNRKNISRNIEELKNKLKNMQEIKLLLEKRKTELQNSLNILQTSI